MAIKPAVATQQSSASDETSILVEKARAGDQRAFEQLYRANVGRVYAVCKRLLADPGRAEDVCQEAFVRAWRMLGTFRGEARFASWLYRLTVNAALLDLRSSRGRTHGLIPIEQAGEFDRAQPPSPETRMDLERAIASLPERARLVFVLHEIEGHDHKEIALLLGVAVGTCKAHLHRARQLLREIVKR